jgi:hypothetical protein
MDLKILKIGLMPPLNKHQKNKITILNESLR